jgi:SAM-dependent methyltransferase
MVPGETRPDGSGSDRAEHERIRRLYEGHYQQERYRRIWGGAAPHFIHDGKWDVVRPLLASLGLPRPAARVLDLGAGPGTDCVELDRIGWEHQGIVALDLVARDLRAARARLPWLVAAVGDACRLPIRDACMDLVFQSTVISSVLDHRLRAAIYAEAARVLKQGGAFVSYDTRYPNPWNPHTRPVRLAELRSAFPGWHLRSRSLTLLPPLVRRLIRVPALCRAAERFPPLRSHLLACALKP